MLNIRTKTATKALFTLILLNAANPAIAQNQVMFSVGAGGVYSNNDVSRKNALTPQATNSFSQNKTGFTGQIEGGYRYIFDSGFYISALAFFNLSSVTSSSNSQPSMAQSYSLELSQKNRFGGLLRLGQRFKNGVSPYVQFGYAKTKYDITSTSNVAPTSKTTSTSPSSFLIGIGGDYAITKSLNLGIDATYSLGKTINFTHQNTGEFSIKPRALSLLVKVTTHLT